ncbi:uncharacterized protein K444DRAFT_641457 [Hyaloscypha bicolor E]|uniref:Uncharacterized protein n=1 Tax=Hyaloscypha bicolor E TaxID=1095630 RepID=A0A2J6TJ85_9HELO|nr:uncharacterized protein K444DRAFT_641457 [Hyaloscypha bicolor E]PMD63075.1 hypothetical protein K444DRAFT_641457 [Hyaloscypha bicolor E]
MKERAGQPDIVWGMFGGNNAFFGAIARACIYQPILLEHPFGWGPPWDEDSDGTGLCKKNIQQAENFLNDPNGIRKEFARALNDIITVAQDTQALNQPFDLYVSSYVHFFDNTTDACDQWSFAHDRLSTGKPKLVKELRTIINDKVQQLNDIQADVIKNYEIPPRTPFNPNFRVHNSQPDSIFNGHRFCEPNHTFEDQYYNQDVWLWNLQYYDEKTGEEQGVTTTNNGVEFMAPPASLDATHGFQTVLGADTNPIASIPQGNDANTQQYGFGWTARPFHPKFGGHTALKDFFIQQMRNDQIPGVKPAVSPPSQGPPTSPSTPQGVLVCNGLGSSKYVTRDIVKDSIQNSFCPDAVIKGPIQERYNQGTPEEVVITLQGPNGFKPSSDDCTKYLLAVITDGCDSNSPQNPANYKGVGIETIGDIAYTIQPQALRQPVVKAIQYGCDSSYKAQFNEYTVWGHG